MNWLDVVLGIVLAASIVSGLIKGFIRTAIGITAAVLAVILGMWFYGSAGSVFQEYVSSRSVSNFLGFACIFLLVLLGGALLGRLLAVLFKWAGLSFVDRILGGCFGLLRGVLICIAIVMALMAFTMTPPPRSVVNSTLSPYILDAARIFSKAAPRELTDGFQSSYDKIRKLWAEAVGTRKWN
ncbi:MAG: CvpA family protein [Bryobacterales bacterium]|nr:CvpA family protein [Bryobacterales bacterium]